MDYSEFCKKIETCLEKMHIHRISICLVNEKLRESEDEYDFIMLNLCKDSDAVLSWNRHRIDRQVELNKIKIYNLGEYEWWKNLLLFLTVKHPDLVKKYEQDNMGFIYKPDMINVDL